jgi:hypothetical protein
MSDTDDVIYLSHRINEIMLKFFKKEDFIEMLVHCVESMIMIPRFELISTIDVLGEYMLEKNKTELFKQKVNNLRKQAETWILSSDNNNFSKIWLIDSKEVPGRIEEMYREMFDSDMSELFEKYVKDMDECIYHIEEKQKKYLRKWLMQTSKESEKESENLEELHLKQMELDRLIDLQQEHNKKFVGGKTFKERQKEAEDLLKDQPKDKKMEKINNITNLKFLDSIQEIKKGDKERFVKIFYAFEKKIGKIPEEEKNMITNLWYGNFFAKEEANSDDILNIVKRYSLRFKIPNDHINGEVNRLILQTYIMGLYKGVGIYDIYTIINDVLDTNPTMTGHRIMPLMIHDGNVPNLKIQDVLNPIIKNLPLHQSQSIIRKNWDKMRFPNIDIFDLVVHINEISMDSALRYKIIASIEDLSDEIIKKGLTIDKFAREVYQIFKIQTMKIPITEKQIVNLLKYE